MTALGDWLELHHHIDVGDFSGVCSWLNKDKGVKPTQLLQVWYPSCATCVQCTLCRDGVHAWAPISYILTGMH